MINDEKKWDFYVSEIISENIAETPEHFLICRNVPIARTGNQIYKPTEVPIEPGKDGTVTIQRDEADVFDEKTIKSFEGKPVTIDHPDEMVTPENWKDLAHGFLQNVRRGIKEQADLLMADLVITTKQAIELVKSGLRQVSCGYDAEYEQIKEGLGRQKEIIGNHVALVMRGRAGARCAIGDKECTHCGKCKINLQEGNIEMGFKKKVRDALLKALDAIPDDEKEKEQEAKDAEAAKVEELKALDKKAKDQFEEKEKKDLEAKDQEVEEEKEKAEDAEAAAKVEELKALDKKAKDQKEDEEEEETKDQDGGIAELTKTVTELVATVATMQKALEALVQSDKAVHESVDKKAKDADEDLEKEKMEAKDCDTVWSDVAYRSDLLAPDSTFNKPMKDYKNAIEGIKRTSLKVCLTNDKEIGTIVGKDIDSLSGENLNIAFIGASELVKAKNNKAVKDSISLRLQSSSSEVRAINEMNKKYWKR